MHKSNHCTFKVNCPWIASHPAYRKPSESSPVGDLPYFPHYKALRNIRRTFNEWPILKLFSYIGCSRGSYAALTIAHTTHFNWARHVSPAWRSWGRDAQSTIQEGSHQHAKSICRSFFHAAFSLPVEGNMLLCVSAFFPLNLPAFASSLKPVNSLL